MSRSGIQFFNRYTAQIETEVVYGEKWLRFILFNPFGQLALHTVAKRAWFSRWYGWRMSALGSKARVKPFIECLLLRLGLIGLGEYVTLKNNSRDRLRG